MSSLFTDKEKAAAHLKDKSTILQVILGILIGGHQDYQYYSKLQCGSSQVQHLLLPHSRVKQPPSNGVRLLEHTLPASRDATAVGGCYRTGEGLALSLKS